MLFAFLHQALQSLDHLAFDGVEIVQVLVEVEKSYVHRLVALQQRFGQNLLVQSIGFADASAQIDPLDGPFELALGYVDKELWRSRGVIVDAVDDAQRVYDEGTTLGKQAVDSCSAA